MLPVLLLVRLIDHGAFFGFLVCTQMTKKVAAAKEELYLMSGKYEAVQTSALEERRRADAALLEERRRADAALLEERRRADEERRRADVALLEERRRADEERRRADAAVSAIEAARVKAAAATAAATTAEAAFGKIEAGWKHALDSAERAGGLQSAMRRLLTDGEISTTRSQFRERIVNALTVNGEFRPETECWFNVPETSDATSTLLSHA